MSPEPILSVEAAPVPPTRRELRAHLWWVCRWLAGHGGYYRGPLSVVLSDSDDPKARSGEATILAPMPGEEIYTADAGPVGGGGCMALVAQLAAAMLSADERKVMGYVAERGPVAAKLIVAKAGVERSRCYTLLGVLKDRGLIRDRGEGYEIVDPGLWEVIRSGRPDEPAGE